ncbi:MAG: anaerobic ribonucleoside-triphosphate reductase activating protein [Candidatus Bathyarchaeota archaeon]|nr:anaerobic ribonucleoside-triphosphate reductase activating protein [Candidatus Bathyarchaeota archaeon]MDH5623443.1 anaerobic ribonucleoside-triphosphate reductase activating protein [Candidatus Bathyarchaeota archaeon]
MEIKGFVDLSLVDWDGKLSSVFFVPSCNFRCPFCYNSTLVLHPERVETIPFERVEGYLKKQRGWIDGICVTGGEPMLHEDLPDICSKLKKMGFLVKIDTNGTNPTMMKELMDRGLVDYIAVDIKAPLTVEEYSKATGINAEKLVGKVKETVEILLRSKMDYEFRTTVVPTLHEEENIKEICDGIKGCRKYVLQKFNVSLGKTTIDPEFSKLKPFTDEEMRTFLIIAQELLSNVKLR